MEQKSGNYKKYMSKNPLIRHATVRFLNDIVSLAGSVDISTILDAGCGEGFVACRFGDKRLIGMDISSRSLTVARQRSHELSLAMGDVNGIPFRDESFDMVIICEVLEHLEMPEKALAEASRVSKRYCLFSVPREPYFMLMNLLRGKYITRLGNNMEHIQHWTMKGFIEYLSQNFDVLDVRCPFPWTVVLCEKRRS
jgi:ubiquinone/menaquinone biosynthesis C-methylase UbiE